MTTPLQPARPDPEGGSRPSYLPRFPWKWVLIGGSALGLFIGGYVYRQTEKTNAIRSQVRAAYGRIDDTVGRRYRTLRERIERLVIAEAARDDVETFRDPRLRFTPLHRAKGLYMRVPHERAGRAVDIAAAMREMEPDAITRCLGILPLSVRGLYDRARVFEPEWRARLSTADSEIPLRALDDELANYARRDLPALARLLSHTEYLLLVLEEPPSRRTSPVRIAMWDMRREPQLLLRHRTQGEGLVIAARVHIAGRHVGRRPTEPAGEMGALDCSIASAMKELTGEATPSVTSVIAPPSARADAGVEPSSSDAGAVGSTDR